MQLHHERHLLHVALASLAVEPDERAAAADRAVHLDVRIGEVAKMADHHLLRIDSDVFEEIELLERRLSRECRCA